MVNPQLIKKYNISVEGNPDAEQVIIFAHGFGTDQNAWKDVKAAFAADYKLILYDNIGGGKADMAAFSPVKYTSLSVYANDLLAIAEAFELKNAIVVAHSVSAMVSLLAALKSPHHFRRWCSLGAHRVT
ncbi:MAG: alpha/beta fold hydrolase [Daejeonella sp.]